MKKKIKLTSKIKFNFVVAEQDLGLAKEACWSQGE